MYEIFNQSKFLERRKELRKSPTPQELKLWFYLKGGKLNFKFRRQQGIGPYIVDFYCKKQNLAIEIDGAQHTEAKEYDKERTEYMETLGIKVLRFWNSEIDKDIKRVLKKIEGGFLPLRRGSAPTKVGARG